jgi:16S rRNA (guanine966-N2)-methyltransferase
MMLRVIAGRLKGRRLLTPAWAGLRPTSDRLRETLFEIIGPDVEGAAVLDGFAGTGALGIEAISRGASSVAFVEHDRRAVALIERNLARCGVTGGYTIVPTRIEAAASRIGDRRFDVILLDPPYDDPALDAAVATASRWLAPRGRLVLEHAARVDPAGQAGGVQRVRRVKAGDSALSFYEPLPPGAHDERPAPSAGGAADRRPEP